MTLEQEIRLERANQIHKQLVEECKKIFGVSFQLAREYRAFTDNWEWTIYTKYLGRRSRFDLIIRSPDLEEKLALKYLISQLPEQMQEVIELYIELDGVSIEPGYFGVARDNTQGVVNPGIVVWPEI